MANPTPIRILAVDDHPLLLEGLAAVIRSQPDMTLVGQASNSHDALRQYCALQPDATLIDLRLRDVNGIDAMLSIQGQFPDARVIVMATFEGDTRVESALQAGAQSYILKNMPPKTIADVIRRVHATEKPAADAMAAQKESTVSASELPPKGWLRR